MNILKLFNQTVIIVICLVIFINCRFAVSQTNSAGQNAPKIKQSTDSNVKSFKTEENSKYGLTVNFYQSLDNNRVLYSKISVDKKPEEVFLAFDRLPTLGYGFFETAWSPDNKYLILDCGGICIYLSSGIARQIGRSQPFTGEHFQGLEFPQEDYFETVRLVSDEGNSVYEYEFVRWENSNTINFKAVRVRFDRTRDEKYDPEEYEYNIQKRRLICLSKTCGFTNMNGKRPKRIFRKVKT